jgi:TRAP-type C4-dicarboxylate transport system substrate-binding protein
MKTAQYIASIAAAAFATLLASAAAQAQTVLNASIWVPPTHPVHAHMMVPWAEQVAKATEGRVKINILTKALGGPAQHFDLVRDGVADIMYTIHGYTPGRFTLTKMAELPFLGDSAEAASVAYWRVYQKHFARANEHQGVKVLGLFMHGPGTIFTRTQPVTKIEDVRRQKFRVGGGVVNDIATSLEMVALLKPATESYELLSNGVVDGLLFPRESVRSFRLIGLIKHLTVVPGGLYNTSFVMGLNQARFDKLSPQDQAALMSVSGEAFARLAGRAWDAADASAIHEFKAAGGTVTEAPAAFVDDVRKRTAGIEQAWIAEARAKNVDGAAALAEFRREIAAQSKK